MLEWELLFDTAMCPHGVDGSQYVEIMEVDVCVRHGDQHRGRCQGSGAGVQRDLSVSMRSAESGTNTVVDRDSIVDHSVNFRGMIEADAQSGGFTSIQAMLTRSPRSSGTHCRLVTERARIQLRTSGSSGVRSRIHPFSLISGSTRQLISNSRTTSPAWCHSGSYHRLVSMGPRWRRSGRCPVSLGGQRFRYGHAAARELLAVCRLEF